MLDRDDFLTDEEYQEALENAIDRAEAMRDEILFNAFVESQSK